MCLHWQSSGKSNAHARLLMAEREWLVLFPLVVGHGYDSIVGSRPLTPQSLCDPDFSALG